MHTCAAGTEMEVEMANTHHPEKAFFDDIVALLTEIKEGQDQVSQLYKDAAEAEGIGKDGVKVLRAAVRRHMMTTEKRELEDKADELLHRLGHLAGTPLGDAAMTRPAA